MRACNRLREGKAADAAETLLLPVRGTREIGACSPGVMVPTVSDASAVQPGPSPVGPARGTRRSKTAWQLVVGVLILAGIFTVLYPDQFATVRNVENMARQGAVLAVVAIGQSFALLVGGFDISVGANMGLSSTVGALVMVDFGVVPGILAGLATGTAVGLTNGVLIAWARVTPFVTTLAMLAIARGLANQLSDGASVSGLPPGFQVFGGGDWGPIPSTVGIAAVVFLVASVLLSRTRPGLYIYAIGGSRETAVLAGVRARRYELLAYTACGFLAGVAGLMLASRVSVGQASLGQGFELLSIATAVIGGVAIGGGVGRLSGVILGVALLSVMTTGMNIAGLSEFIQEILTGIVLVAAVLIDRIRSSRPIWPGRRPQPASPGSSMSSGGDVV